MHVLFLTFFFPPHNTIGAVRTGKTAKYLEQMGHRVSVISAAPQMWPPTLPLEIPPHHVTYTNWIGHPQRKRPNTGQQALDTPASNATGLRGKAEAVARRAYTELMMPDQEIGWFPFAWRAAHDATRRGDVDIILASAGPFTSLLVARSIARSSHLPWVADLRDLWMDNPHRQHYLLRDPLEARLERRTLGSASALVTVGPALATTLSASLNRPVEVVYNGYEPDTTTPSPGAIHSDRLVIRYTGSIWEERLPIGLFRCLRERAAVGAPILLEFFGHNLDAVRRAAETWGVLDVVHCGAEVSHEESLRLQREADVLLLTMAESRPGERGTLTGKLFEYMNARRPILLLGCPDGAAADLVRTAHCGVVVENDAQLMSQLEQWQRLKLETGAVPPAPPPPAQFTRAEQTLKLAAVLERVLGRG
jgi:glycosyltransferase involved in cell wall biosynthesis